MEKPHKRLKAWQLTMDIAVHTYKISERFPAGERFGLTSQTRRRAVSVPSNIAEGAGRKTRKGFVSFLYIAKGSLSELDTQLELSKHLEYLDEATWKALNDKLVEEDKVLSGLIRSQVK